MVIKLIWESPICETNITRDTESHLKEAAL